MPLLMPNFATLLEPLRQDNQPFKVAQIQTLQALFMALYQAQSESGFFSTEVILDDGSLAEREILHIGPFTLLFDGSFLSYSEAVAQPVVSAAPSLALSRAAERLGERSADSGFVLAPIDLSHGAALTAMDTSPTLRDYMAYSGAIGFLIVVLGFTAFTLVVYKIVTLLLCARAVLLQRCTQEINYRNPLGRLMSSASYPTYSKYSEEELEWKLARARLSEISILDYGLSAIKVFIIVAPLLGLLGTVLGILETFQAIAAAAAGDPTVMAQGISQALVTTFLGLSVAIPLLLLYTWAVSLSKGIRETLEQESAYMMAKHLQEKRWKQ